MAARTSVRLEPLARDIALLFDEELSPAAQAQKLTEAAREALLDAQGINRQALG
ncbi:hypothetical protein [Methylobacterium sp. Leaf91]|uniref:hypothetical protein n=1 Tax=Methylobacterium sp. Leaf91 TaxID=1736247 RepID=UPI000A7AECBB|nr:hypothetical protein [Methylobacterium sp. Leaf91]